MEINVFNHDYEVVIINSDDVVSLKWVKKHFEYRTLTKIYHGSSNAKEEAELHAGICFVKISTTDIINLKFIERFVEKGVIVNGVFYKLSRRKLVDLKRQLIKYLPNSHTFLVSEFDKI